ncbi:hypothetical protein OH76DRAFT_1397234 [Lentinus brumalis]|uniref:Uncharacterized protein n=1 Tax=Lentinus brumalis TaxID=2498619 RepID=A0A371DQU8_9APHY|nr:hypothetical protein OH76DRAFT_1397234 [Polyporus brumalis]
MLIRPVLAAAEKRSQARRLTSVAASWVSTLLHAHTPRRHLSGNLPLLQRDFDQPAAAIPTASASGDFKHCRVRCLTLLTPWDGQAFVTLDIREPRGV